MIKIVKHNVRSYMALAVGQLVGLAIVVQSGNCQALNVARISEAEVGQVIAAMGESATWIGPYNGDETVISASSELVDVWKGNRPQLSVGLDGVWVEFRYHNNSSVEAPEDGAKEATPIVAQATPEPFMVNVRFERDATVVSSSNVADSKYEGGVKFVDHRARSTTFFMRGEGRASLAIVAPRVDLTQRRRNRAVLICPVEPEPYFPPQSLHQLAPSGYEPARVAFDMIAAVAKGQQIAGIGDASALAEVLVTSNIPVGRQMRDLRVSKDPSASVSFKVGPANEEALREFPAAGAVGGVEAAVELVNPAGYSRRSALQEVISVVPVNEDYRFNVVAFGEAAAFSTRGCVLIYRARGSSAKYSKESVASNG